MEYDIDFLNQALEKAQPSHARLKEPILLSPPQAPLQPRGEMQSIYPSQSQRTPSDDGTGRGSTSGGSTVSPFDVLASDATHVRVRYGTVNSIIPTGMSIGDDPPFVISFSGNAVVYLHLSVAFDDSTSLWSITGLEILTGASVPTASSGGAYCSLGSVASGGGAVATDARGSLQWERCGDDTNFIDTFQR